MEQENQFKKLNKEALKCISEVEGCALKIALNYEELLSLNKQGRKLAGEAGRNFEAGYTQELENLKGVMQVAHEWYRWTRFTR